MTGIVTFENPNPSDQIVDVDIIEPNAVQVLAADDEKFITRDGGKVSITGFGRGMVGFSFRDQEGGIQRLAGIS